MSVKVIEKVYEYCYYSAFIAKYEFCFKPPIRLRYSKWFKKSRDIWSSDIIPHYAIRRHIIGDYHVLSNKLSITEIKDYGNNVTNNNNDDCIIDEPFLKKGKKVDTTKLRWRIWRSIFGIHIYTDIKIKDYINSVKYSLESVGYSDIKCKLMHNSEEFNLMFMNNNNSGFMGMTIVGGEPEYKYKAKKIIVDY